MVGSVAADLEFHRSKAFRTTSFVSSTVFVNVNSNVNTTTIKLYADKLSPFRLGSRLLHLRFRWRIRITDNIKHKKYFIIKTKDL